MELKSVQVEAIQVTGHTDRLGSKAYNAKLSTRRAEAVQNYLVQIGGEPANKVTAIGVGSAEPDTQFGDCQGIKTNQALITCLRVDRRVEVQSRVCSSLAEARQKPAPVARGQAYRLNSRRGWPLRGVSKAATLDHANQHHHHGHHQQDVDHAAQGV